MAATPVFEHHTICAEDILDRSCIIYGGSGCGKSTAIQHLLFLLRDHIPTVIVFSGSEQTNGLYSRHMVPRQLVHDSLNGDIIGRIMTRQQQNVQIYKKATNEDVTRKLFEKYASAQDRETIRRMQDAYDSMTRDVSASMRDKMNDTFRASVRKIRANVIRKARTAILADASASSEEKISAKFIDLNPRVVVVVDDCSSDLSRSKTNEDILESLFRGRHIMMTILIGVHALNSFSPAARSNAHVSVFMDGSIANAFAQNSANGILGASRDEFIRYSRQICKDTSPYTKMIRFNDHIALCTFSLHEPFCAVAHDVAEYCKKIERMNREEDTGWMSKLV